jgi:hypothetical protein
MRWDVTKAIIYRIRAQGNWGPSLILFVCFTSHHCYAPIAAPTGSGNGEKRVQEIYLLFFCWVVFLSLSVLFVHNDSLVF